MKRFRQVVRKLHLWLGMTSGLIVLVVALSGSLYVFEGEFRDCLEEYRHAEATAAPMLPPSQLRAIAEKQLPGQTASRVYYEGPRRAAYVQFGNLKTPYYTLVFLDPHDGRVLRVQNMNREFFHIMFSLHYRLLLPPELGTMIVDYATLIFVLTLLSGLVIWWPLNRATLRKRLVIQWKAGWQRKSYDFHTVLGLYAFPFLLIIALTGLVWGFDWFSSAVYRMVSGGQSEPPFEEPASRSAPMANASPAQNVDTAWNRLSHRYADAETTIVFFPRTSQSSIRFVISPDRSSYYKTDQYYLDQYSLAELPVQHSWGKYADTPIAGIVRRMNYDIHTGRILGLPGKILALLAGLIATSLPITGFLIWWGKRRRTPRNDSCEGLDYSPPDETGDRFWGV